jgi:SAM-dependent methyltransferase
MDISRAKAALRRVYDATSAVVNRRRRRGTFTLEGREYAYFIHIYNKTWMNERIAEMALGLDALQRHRGERILEVGNVMSHYGHDRHEIVDLYEQADGVQNVDIVDFRPADAYDLILSLSTIEHVGFDEDIEEPDKPVRAVTHLKEFLRPGGELLVTVPLGYNRHVDLALRADAFGFDRTGYLMRVSPLNRWAEVGADQVRRARYGLPYPAANVIAVGTYIEPPSR